MSYNDNVDMSYGNPFFSLNSSDNSNAFLAFSTQNKINLRLVNDILNSPNDFSIVTENNSFQLVSGNNRFYSFQNDSTVLHSDVSIGGNLTTAGGIYNANGLTIDSPSHSFVSNGIEQMKVDNTGLNILTSMNVKGRFNIDLPSLPKEIVLTDKNNTIPPTLLPTSSSQGRMIFGNGTKFGIGTTIPRSKLHVYDGHTLLESGYIAINELYDTSPPLAPIHIRSQGARVGTPQMILNDSSNIPSVILMADKPFVGIGTSEYPQTNDVGLYVRDNVMCHSSITAKDLFIDSNIHIDSSNITFWKSQSFSVENATLVMKNSDILFNGYSASNAILHFYGMLNNVFGTGTAGNGYRVDINNDTSNVLAIGTTANTEAILTFYTNNTMQHSISLVYHGDSNLYIDSNKIITTHDIGRVAYLDQIDFKELSSNPFNTSNIPITRIVDIASENKRTLILLDDDSIYSISNLNSMTRVFPWFQLASDEHISSIKMQQGITMYFTTLNNMFYEYNGSYNNVANCMSAVFDGISIYYISPSNQLFRIMMFNNQTISIQSAFSPTGIGLMYQSASPSVIFYSGSIVYDQTFGVVEQNFMDRSYRFYHLYKDSNTLLKISNYPSNLLEITESYSGFYYDHADIVYVDATDNTALFIDINGMAYYLGYGNGSYSVAPIVLSPLIFNTSDTLRFRKGITYSDYMVLFDASYDTLFTKSFSQSYDGLGRGPATSLGVIPADELVPIMVPVTNDNTLTTNNMMIGSSMRFKSLDNIPTNSLSVENCIGVRIPANDMYSLNISGNINIVAGDILIDGIPLKLGGDNVTSNITGNSEGYINVLNFGQFFNQEIESYRTQPTGFYNKVECDTRFITNNQSISNIGDALAGYMSISEYNSREIWSRSADNVIYTSNTSVVINSNMPMMNVAGNGIIPALYVANNGNIRGILCDDNIAAYSDIRLKTNLERIPDPLQKIQQLNGYYYNRVNDFSPDRRHVGLIAQEVEKVLPEVVSTFNGTKTLSYQNIIALLVEAIKELTNKINK